MQNATTHTWEKQSMTTNETTTPFVRKMDVFNDTSTVSSNYSSVTPSTIFTISNFTNLSSTAESTTSHLYNGTGYSETVQTSTQSLQTESTTKQLSLNLTSIAKDSLPNVLTTATSSLCTTTTSTTTTEDSFDEFGPPEGVEYIFVPLGVMIFVIILSAVVIIISRKRKLERLRHRLMPLYNFDPGEEGEDDWETELLDEGFTSRQRRHGYQSMDSEENAELFSTARN